MQDSKSIDVVDDISVVQISAIIKSSIIIDDHIKAAIIESLYVIIESLHFNIRELLILKYDIAISRPIKSQTT